MGIMSSGSNRTLEKQGETPGRPPLLKIICILSFIICGLWILVFLVGWLITMNMQEKSLSAVWDKVVSLEPKLETADPMAYMRELSKVSLYFLLANIASLIGVVMMWRLNRIGFFVYAAAELITNFFSINIAIPDEQRSYTGLIFYLVIDILFIVLYAMNLKYMKKGVS